MTQTLTTTTASATPNQAVFILKLLTEREGYSDGFAVRVRGALDSGAMTKAEASKVIDWMLKLAKRSTAAVAAPVASGIPGEDGTPPLTTQKDAVPAGHYAATVPGSGEPLSFFRVDTPTSGKWAGYTFVKHVVGGHPDFPVRGAAKHAALDAIRAAGIVESATRYAKEFRRCVHCNTQLTDPISRALCVGPHCRAGKAKGGMTALLVAMAAAMEDVSA